MTLITLVTFTLNLYISNRKENTKDSEINDNKKYSIVVLILITLSILYDLFLKFSNLFVYLAVAIGETFFFIIQNVKREEIIKKKHEEMKQLLQCLSPVLDIPKGEELDLEGDYGMELKRDKKGLINEIVCEMRDPDKWSDNVLTKIVLNMNKYLPEKRWTNRVDYSNLQASFIGNDLPPRMAKYPGSWLRPFNFIPIGVNGDNELGLNYGAKEKTIGDSLFAFNDDPEKSEGGSILDHKSHDGKKWDDLEKGWRQATAVISPKTPQIMVCGSTGGGKAIYTEQKIKIS